MSNTSRKLVLYSDQLVPDTDAIDRRLLSLVGTRGRRVGYIPSQPDRERRWFAPRVAYYARLGLAIEVYFGLEDDYAPGDLSRLLSCDAIHLAGGNTFRFLHWLRSRGMIHVLRDYVAGGGVLIGVSAGAILMTPNIGTAALCVGDDPYPGLDDLSGLSLVDFEFLPHFDGSPSATAELLAHSKTAAGRVYACRDGGGIVVDGDDIETFDRLVCAEKGTLVAE